MAIKNQALTVNFLAWDTSANAGKTGDSGNFTLRLIKDGGAAAAPTNAVSEPDSTNMPGVYELALTADEMNANFVTLGGKSSTANIVIYPIFFQTERGDLATVDTVVDAIKAITDNLPNSGALSDIDTGVNNIEGKLPSKNYLAGTANSDGDIELADATGAFAAGAYANHTAVDLNADQSAATVGTVNNLGTNAKSHVNAEVVDALATDTYSEPAQAAPSNTPTLSDAINQLYRKIIKDKVVFTKSTGVESTYMNDGTTVRHKRTVTDNATATTKGAAQTGA